MTDVRPARPAAPTQTTRPHGRTSTRPVVAYAMTVLLAVTGCGKSTGDPAAATSPAVSARGSGGVDVGGAVSGVVVPGDPTSAAAPPTAATTTKAAPATPTDPVLAQNGKTAVMVKAVNLGAGTITVDTVTLIMDPAAVKAYWHKWHPNEPDGPPEGYVFQNITAKSTALTLTGSATVKLIDLDAADPSVATTGSQADLAGQLTDDRYKDPTSKGIQFPFWATTKNGQVTALEEVYLA